MTPSSSRRGERAAPTGSGTRLSTRGRRTRLTAALAVALVLGATATAIATDIIYHNGFLYSNQTVSGPRHSLTANSARKIGSSITGVCVITRDGNNPGVYDSTAVCTYVQDGLAYHAFCGCKLRYPDTYATSAGGGTDTRARLSY